MRRVLAPIAVGVLTLILWEVFVTAGRVAPFILPAPSAIWAQIVEQRQNERRALSRQLDGRGPQRIGIVAVLV